MTGQDAWNIMRGRRDRVVARKLRQGRRNRTAVSLTRSEMRIVFDRAVRRELNMSGADFLRRLDAGSLPDDPIVQHLSLLAGGPRTR
jgi:hypothetical protein